jgi:hypothetical protein|tara:strand:+ start:779 stop:1183 length:405 start_codon:yes stop_codon:yes gene_type:complete
MGKRSKGFDKGELDVVNSRLASLIDVADISVPKIIKKVSGNIQKDVEMAAPVVTGNLKRSIYRDVGQYKAHIFVDTTRTDPRRTNFEYGRIVEHGRAGRYKTTPYWYRIVKANLGTLTQFINSAVRNAASNSKK